MRKIGIFWCLVILILAFSGCATLSGNSGKASKVASRISNVKEIKVVDSSGNGISDATIIGSVKNYNTSRLTDNYGSIEEATGEKLIEMDAIPYVLTSTEKVNLTTGVNGTVATDLKASTLDKIINFDYDGMKYSIDFTRTKSVAEITVSKKGYFSQTATISENENPVLTITLASVNSITKDSASKVSDKQSQAVTAIYNAISASGGELTQMNTEKKLENGKQYKLLSINYPKNMSDNITDNAKEIITSLLTNVFKPLQNSLESNLTGVHAVVSVGKAHYDFYISSNVIKKYGDFTMTKSMIFDNVVVLYNGKRIN